MDIKKLVQHALVDKGISLRELARIMDTTVQNLSNKLQRNDIRISDLEKIFEAMEFDLSISYKAKDNS